MLSRVALLATARAILVPSTITLFRLSSERKLSVRKSSRSTAVLNHSVALAVPAGGCLLEWQPAQLSANARRPALSVSGDAVRNAAPPVAFLSNSGFIVFRKASALAIRASVLRQSRQFLRA